MGIRLDRGEDVRPQENGLGEHHAHSPLNDPSPSPSPWGASQGVLGLPTAKLLVQIFFVILEARTFISNLLCDPQVYSTGK